MRAQSCPTLCNPMDCSPVRLLCPWNFSGKNTRVDCHFLLQGIFPTQGSKLPLFVSPALAFSAFSSHANILCFVIFSSMNDVSPAFQVRILDALCLSFAHYECRGKSKIIDIDKSGIMSTNMHSTFVASWTEPTPSLVLGLRFLFSKRDMTNFIQEFVVNNNSK